MLRTSLKLVSCCRFICVLVALAFATRAGAQTTGGCCLPSGICSTETQCSCFLQGGVFLGVGSGCAGTSCQQFVYGACCTPSGCFISNANDCRVPPFSAFFPNQPCTAACGQADKPCCCGTACFFIDPSACTAAGGTSASGSSCTPNPCAAPVTGACCTPCTGACTNTTAAQCPGAGMFFPNQPCAPGVCIPQPLFGRCCLGQVCSYVSSCDCVNKGGTFYGPTGVCTAAQCAQEVTGSCCNPNTGVCMALSSGSCAQIGGNFLAGQPCSAQLACQSPGGACCCCGACHVFDAITCALSGGTFTAGATCTPNFCQNVTTTGACCVPGLPCQVGTQTQCLNNMGVWFPNGACQPDPCTTACCDPATGACTPIFASNQCPVGQISVANSTCTPNPCLPTKVCCDPATGACQPITAVGCPAGWTTLTGVTCQPNNPCPPPPPTYACCDPTTGNCTPVTSTTACPAPGILLPNVSSCTPNPCVVGGSCCTQNGCIVTTDPCDCYINHNGGPFSPGVPCNPASCPVPIPFGACCVPNTAGIPTCVQTTPGTCALLNGSFTGGPCNVAGGCQSSPVACCCNGTCTMIDAALCTLAGGSTIFGATCSPFTCNPGAGACCDPATGICTNVAAATACPATAIFYPGQSCNQITCPPPPPYGACCTGCTAACVYVSQSSCPGAGNFIPNTTCNPNPCPTAQLMGACCFSPNCAITNPCECVYKAGTWLGPSITCSPQVQAQCATNPNLATGGACCSPTTNSCHVTSLSMCNQIGGAFTPNVTCAALPTCNATPPACCCCNNCKPLDPAFCAIAGGSTLWGSTCTQFTCQPNSGACCNPATGACNIVSSQQQCVPPLQFYLGQTCAQISCVQTGACCDVITGLCQVTVATQCPSPLFTFTPGGSCLPPNAVTCPITGGGCCNPATGTCSPVASPNFCLSPNIFLGPGIPCPLTPCIPPYVRCCNPNTGACSVVSGNVCPTGLTALPGSLVCTPNPCPPVGSCCKPNSAICTIVTQSLCTNGIWTLGGSCTPNPCVGACCDNITGACTQIFINQTCPTGSTFAGAGTSCANVLCPVLVSTCCNSTTGACSMVFGGLCPPGTFPISGLCFFNPCPPVGPCCIPGTIICTMTVQTQCNGVWGPAGGSCQPNPCAGACCNTSTGGCTITAQASCPAPNIFVSGGTCQPSSCPGACCNVFTGLCSIIPASACVQPNLFLGNGSACPPLFKCKPGVCCSPNGACTVVVNSLQCPSSAGYFLPGLTSCQPNPCRGACCATNGACTILTPQQCLALGRLWLGPNTTCFPNPCPVACCLTNGNCTVVPFGQCTSPNVPLPTGSCNPTPCKGACCYPPVFGGLGSHCVYQMINQCTGQWQGFGVTCTTPPNTNNFVACCKANFNGVGGVTVQDIFDFLSAWFANNPSANFNGVGGVTVQDIFDFLSAWFAGCT